jgi:hypothetical protein
MALKQIEKFSASNLGYKNKMIECLNASLSCQDDLPSLDEVERVCFEQL